MRPNQIPIFLRPVPVVVVGTFPTMVGTPTTATGASGTLAYPAGIAVGDRIYVVVYGGAGSITSSTFAAFQSGTGNLGTPYAIYTRTADGTETASATITGSASAQYTCWVEHGVNATPEEGWSGLSAYSNVPSGTSITTPSATSTKTNCWQIIGIWENQNLANTVNTAPAGATLIKLFTGSESVALYFVPQAAAGASGTNTFAWTSGVNNFGDSFSFISRSA